MKNWIIILAILTSNLIFSQSIYDNLLLHYAFSGNAHDSSVNNFNGITNASPTSDRFDNANEAYSFNGSNEYIDFPNVSALKPQLPVSFLFWVRFDDLQAENTVIFTTDFAQNNHSGVWMNLTSTGSLSISYGDASGNTTSSTRRSKVGTTRLNTNKWYQVAGIVKGPTDMEIYINCKNDDGTYSGSGENLAYTSNAGSIGRKDGHISRTAYYFKGAIDDFHYWDRALSKGDIDKLCQYTLSNKEIQATENTLVIYPNPAKELLQIKTKEEFETVSIYNSLGELVYSSKFKTTLNIKHLASGFYYLHLKNNLKNIRRVQKVIIQN